MPDEIIKTGREAFAARLISGETISFRESGNSMTPMIKHRQLCTYAPVKSTRDIQKGDAVFCKVGSKYYTHKVLAVKISGDGHQFLIGNNKGRENGWIPLSRVFGKVVAVAD